MADIETPAVPQTFRLRPQWQAWVVTAAAWAAVVLCAAYLEGAVRSDIREAIKVEPPSWSDPQVRAYASARSHYAFDARARLLQQVVRMKPTGAITAAAASDLLVYGPRGDEFRYALLATRAAPADSPLLAVYYSMASGQLVREKRAPEAIALLTEGVERAIVPKGRGMLLSRLLSTVAKARGLDAALEAYAEYDRRLPDVAHDDRVQEELAYLLEQGRRQADADRIRRYLAANATNSHIRQRAREHLSTGGGHGD